MQRKGGAGKIRDFIGQQARVSASGSAVFYLVFIPIFKDTRILPIDLTSRCHYLSSHISHEPNEGTPSGCRILLGSRIKIYRQTPGYILLFRFFPFFIAKNSIYN
jgi:hypothetical protein